MATINKNFFENIKMLRKLPMGVYFDTTETGFEFQAYTQLKAKQIRQAFSGVIWRKSYNKGCSWWEYKTKIKGTTLRIYAINEKPKKCEAVYEEREVQERVAIEFETRTVKKKVIVGWNCGGKKPVPLTK